MKSKDTCIHSGPHGIITETRKPEREYESRQLIEKGSWRGICGLSDTCTEGVSL